MKTKLKIILTILAASVLLPHAVFAHENYVLTKDQIAAGMDDFSINVLTALKNPGNMRVSLVVAVASTIGIIIYFLFYISEFGQKIDKYMKSYEEFGHVFIRIALGISLIFSAYSNAFLGPEVSINSILIPGVLLKALLYIMGILLILGAATEIIGLIFYGILIAATFAYKDYVLTYFNYIGEAVAFIFFGSRYFALDGWNWGVSKFATKYKDLEIAIIRIAYGVSVMYPAISIKLLHPKIIIDIVNQYHMNQFHWLFPSDPLLISLGTGLAQVAVGICLILGFETRLNSLVTFTLMLMSVLFFKEAVWPHYILLALALYLIINNGGDLSLDYYLLKKIKGRKENAAVSVEAQEPSSA